MIARISITRGNAESLEAAVNALYESQDEGNIRVKDVQFPSADMVVVFYESTTNFGNRNG